MKALLERLHTARLILASREAEVAQAREAFEAAKADLFRRREEAQMEATEADQAVRQAAITAFRETGDLKPLPGVQIKMMPRPLEYEEHDALNWAKKHDMALALDKGKFEKLVKGDPDAFRGFVTIPEKEPRAFIDGDLGPVLDGMKEEETHADS